MYVFMDCRFLRELTLVKCYLLLQMHLFLAKKRRSSKAADKPYKCQHPGCNCSFYASHSLRNHETLKHGRQRKFRKGQSIMDTILRRASQGHPSMESLTSSLAASGLLPEAQSNAQSVASNSDQDSLDT